MSEKYRLRNHKIHLFVTEDEYRIAQEKADYACQGNVSEYVRCIMVDGVIITYDTENIMKAIYELNRIGNNINQIAKHVNEVGEVNIIDFESLQEEYEKMFGYYSDWLYSK